MTVEESIEKARKILKEIIDENLDIQGTRWFTHVCNANNDLKIALDHLNGKFKRLNKKMFG